jgi:hypothetical protein
MNTALEMSCVKRGYSTGISGGKGGFGALRHDGEADGVSDNRERRNAGNPDGREPE